MRAIIITVTAIIHDKIIITIIPTKFFRMTYTHSVRKRGRERGRERSSLRVGVKRVHTLTF